VQNNTAGSDRTLPLGTVTFLFTDIEGSTRLVSELGDAFPPLLDAHAQILRSAIANHGGTEVNTEGDAFFAVFASAAQAVAAAVEAQRSLASHPWPPEGTVRVRMGLHTGEARLGGDDYVGLDVHRAARIASAGHGGQVLISDATGVLVTQELPDGVALRDVGTHRLKDLSARERLWQLDIDGLQLEFPPVRSLDGRPNNLPLATTTLIGRTDELAAVGKLLRTRRLLTLTGPGGTGKTRLALAAAQQGLSDFADGVFFVPLENARDRSSAAAAIAATLGVRERPGRDVGDSLQEHVQHREMLLVLDNFEQLLSASPLVSELLAGSPNLRVLVTSRALLHLSGEQAYDVQPLGLPDLTHLPAFAALSQYEAVALFIDRARAVKPDFAVTNANAPAVAGICSRLDGLPLAIELAAARIKVLDPEAILARLERRLPLLIGGAADQPARQRTLRGAIEWSHELLDDPERRCFQRLAVFAGGWTIEAADRVCNPDEEPGIDTLELLTSLADKSLVHAAEGSTGEPRFEMLQVIREFAQEKLAGGPEMDEIRRRHALHMVAVAEEAEPQLLRSDVRLWQARLRREEDNLRAALRWALEEEESDIGLRIAAPLWRFWHYWTHLREGRGWLESLLELPGASPPSPGRAKALSALAAVVYWQGDAERSAALYEEALEIHRGLGDEGQIAEALLNTAWAAAARDDVRGAIERAEEALDHYRRADDRAGQADVTAWLRTGEYLMGGRGSAEAALAATREAMAEYERLGRAYDVADAKGGIATIYWMAGDHEHAYAAFIDTVRAWYAIGHTGMLAWLKLLARLEIERGHPERAVRLAAVAQRSIEELGGELPAPMTKAGDPLEDVRALLSPEEWDRGVAEGRSMDVDEAVAYVLEGEAP
jgi:predicted ATPase/class 3 adenylate cyclase